MKNIPCSRKKDILVIKQRDKRNYIINHEQESSPIAKMKNKNTVSPRIDGEIPNVSKYIRTFSNINSFNQDHCMDNNKAENFTGWISEDPDDWNSFSDYERKVQTLVNEYNLMALDTDMPLLRYSVDNPLGSIVGFSELNTDVIQYPALRQKLQEIRLWSRLRMQSSHPDDPDRSQQLRSDMADIGLKEKYLTAKQNHFLAMNSMAYWWDDERKTWRQRTKPTPAQAADYLECVKASRQSQVRQYEAMHLDMRDVSFWQNGRCGLRQADGQLLIPPIDATVTERYDRIDTLRESQGRVWCVPVRRGDKYALCTMDGSGTLLTDFVYDHIFRYFGGRVATFVVEQDGRKGLISQHDGQLLIPCEMDEIYEMPDTDAAVPFKKNGKWDRWYHQVK